jgi:hypothetical protein
MSERQHDHKHGKKVLGGGQENSRTRCSLLLALTTLVNTHRVLSCASDDGVELKVAGSKQEVARIMPCIIS